MGDAGLEEGGGVQAPPPPGLVARVTASRLARSVRGDGLKARAMRGSAWTIAGYGAGQIVRLASNLILTRLLFPEAFGVMSLLHVFLQGLQMISDVGIGPSIIQHERGEDPRFLDTAWTIQIARGGALWLASCALAWPFAALYDEPTIVQLLPVLGLTALINGFRSTAYFTVNRRLDLGRLTVVQLVSQVGGTALMIAWALLTPTIWALVGGSVAGALLTVALSFTALRGHRHRIRVDRGAAHDLIRFGKWIFLGTLATYAGGEGLRLLQGALVPMDLLGMISIAAMLAWSLGQLCGMIESRVLFPAYAMLRRRDGDFRRQMIRSRALLLGAVLPGFAVLAIFGPMIIDVLYDDRYAMAGPFLTALAISGAFGVITMPYGSALLATGASHWHAAIMVVFVVLRIGTMLVGFWLGGAFGMLLASAVVPVLIYPLQAVAARRQGFWAPGLDGAAALVAGGIAAVALVALAYDSPSGVA